MSETISPKELPHEFLLKRHKLNISDLSVHTQQLKKDLDKTLVLVINRSKEGNINLTPQTQQKISTYDRYICDGIFEYLEEQDELTDKQVEAEEVKLENKREVVEEKMEKAHEEAVEEKKEEETTPEPVEETNEVEVNQDTPKEEKKSGGDSIFELFDF